MTCFRCRRPLQRASVTRGGRMYGPRCAQLAGLNEKKRQRAANNNAVDERQMDWVAGDGAEPVLAMGMQQ